MAPYDMFVFGDELFMCDDCGLCIAINLKSRSFVWKNGYNYFKVNVYEGGWASTHVALYGDTICFMPKSSFVVIGIDRITGDRIYEVDVIKDAKARYGYIEALGIFGSNLVFAGERSLNSFDLNRGENLWLQPLPNTIGSEVSFWLIES